MKKKRMLNVLLAISLVVSMVIGMSTNVLAANEVTIDTVTVTETPIELEEGKTPADYADQIVVPESDQYEVLTDWYRVIDEEKLEPISEDYVLKFAEEYSLIISFRPKAGYVLPEDDWEIWAEAGEYYWCGYTNYGGNAEDQVYYLEYRYAITETITEVEVSGIPTAEIGAVITASGMSVPEGVNYEIDTEETGWFDYTTGGWAEEGTTFQDGHKYELCIQLSPKAGYIFSEETVLKLDGEEVSMEEYWAGDTYLVWTKVYSYATIVSDSVVEVTMDEPEVGMTADDINIAIPEDVDYTLTSVEWYDIEDYEIMGSDEKFEIGHEYFASIYIDPQEGYEFDFDEIDVKINGELYEDYIVIDDGTIVIDVTYVFYGDIAEVAITNVPEAEVGEEVSYKGFDVLKGAGYSINWDETYWLDLGEYMPLEEGDVFEQSHEYMLNIAVVADKGKGFAENVTVTVNGEAVYDYMATASAVYIMDIASFLNEIDQIEILDPLPDAVAGEQAEEMIECKTPEDAKYEAGAMWYVYSEDGELEEFTGTFEEGKVYFLVAVVMAEEGYEFAGNVEVLAGGEPVDTVHRINMGTIYTILEVHDLGNNTINEIEITFEEPEIGAEISTDVKVPDGANYEIGEVLWIDADTYETVTGKFEEGKTYALSLEIIPASGMFFANDLVIIVNGEIMTAEELAENSLMTPMAGILGFTYDFAVEEDFEGNDTAGGMIDKDSVDNSDNEASMGTAAPKTGDNANLTLWMTAAMIAMVCVVAVLKKRVRE